MACTILNKYYVNCIYFDKTRVLNIYGNITMRCIVLFIIVHFTVNIYDLGFETPSFLFLIFLKVIHHTKANITHLIVEYTIIYMRVK